MPKIKVKLKEAFCEKPKCKNSRHHRHHRGHEFLFAIRWQELQNLPDLVDSLGEAGKNMVAWVKRYWQFRDEDLVGLCPRHHAEIHLIYDQVIMRHNRKVGRPLDLYSYEQAVELRDELRKVCDEWMKQETKGVPPSRVFGRSRTANQRKAKAKKDGRKKKGSNDKE